MENLKHFEANNSNNQESSVKLSEAERNSLGMIYKAINAFSESEEKHYFGNRVDLSQSQLVNELRESGIEPSAEMAIDALNSIVKSHSEAGPHANAVTLFQTEEIIKNLDPNGLIFKKIAQAIPEMSFTRDWNSFLFSVLDCTNEGDFTYWENAKKSLRKLILD